MSAEEFLAWDETQTLKHEFMAGEVYLMAGGEDRHYSVALNLAIALRPHLRGTRCRVYGSDVKLRIDAADCYFYPDLMVTCSERDAGERLIKRDAVLVVEVLSPSTSAFDRGQKFACYRQMPELREYLVVDIEHHALDLYRKGSDGLWVLHPARGDEPLTLASVGLTLPAAAVWDDLEGDAPAPASATPPGSAAV